MRFVDLGPLKASFLLISQAAHEPLQKPCPNCRFWSKVGAAAREALLGDIWLLGAREGNPKRFAWMAPSHMHFIN